MQTKLNQYIVHYTTSQEYHELKREIFSQGIYYFEADNDAPVIIDAGAHIGLATLYFKSLYPDARITAIEPYPRSFELLNKIFLKTNSTRLNQSKEHCGIKT